MKKLLLFSTLFLLLTACEKENTDCPGASEKTFALTGFNRINAGETFKVSVVKGNDYSIKAKGCGSDLADLQLSVGIGQMLDIRYNQYKSNRYGVEFTITLPILASVIATGESDFTINGFEGQPSAISTIMSGTSVCKLNGAPVTTRIELSGKSSFTGTGITEILLGTVSSDSRLYGYGLAANEVDITTSGTSKTWVFPQQAISIFGAGDSRVYYKGNPPARDFIVSGTSQVIHE